MDNADKYLKYSLRMGGSIILIIGAMHAFMPEFGYPPNISEQMLRETRDHFYYLGTYAIGAFLLTLSFLSFYFSKLTYPQNSMVFALSQVALWSARTVLEVVYPVTVPIFFLTQPTRLLLPLMIITTVIYLFGSGMFAVGTLSKKTALTKDFD